MRVENSQHDQIHAAHHLFVEWGFGARFAEAVVIDDDLGAGFQGGDEGFEDLDGVGVGVVVEDPAEEVD